MNSRCAILSGLWFASLVVLMHLPARAATLPPTNLLVNLNGDSAGNFLVGSAANAGKVQVWYDAAHSGTAATQQDFGVGGAATVNMPNLVSHAFPSGLSTNILNFDRAVNTGGASTGGPTISDFLGSKPSANARTATFGAAFTEGVDSAYAGLSGISWFTVFRTNLGDNEPDVNGGRGTATQVVIRSLYTTPNTNTWATVLTDNVAGVTDADTIPEIAGHGRSSSLSIIGRNAGNVAAGRWYIVGNSWNETADSLRTVVIDQSGVTILDSTVAMGTGDIGTVGATVRLGRTTSTGQAFFSGDMAEVLVYSSALDSSDMNSVMTYLNEKYLIPEPSSMCLSGISLLCAAAFFIRKKK